jgi:Ca2+-binding RTX toxin-like protein
MFMSWTWPRTSSSNAPAAVDGYGAHAGADTLIGGFGSDRYYVGVGDTVLELAGQGTDSVFSGVSWTLGASLERLYLTGNTAINGTGNELNNTLGGHTSAAANVLTGGLGNDLYYVGAGDTAVELAGQGSDSIYSSLDWSLGAHLERLYLTGSAAVNGTGNELANTLSGYANSAANVLTGGLGNDLYVVGIGDTIVELAGEGTDTVYCYGDYTLSANVENLTLNAATAAILTGNELANTLRGNAGVDTLIGGFGNDILFGGGGWDTFFFGSGFGQDRIRDFISGEDVIELSMALGGDGFFRPRYQRRWHPERWRHQRRYHRRGHLACFWRRADQGRRAVEPRQQRFPFCLIKDGKHSRIAGWHACRRSCADPHSRVVLHWGSEGCYGGWCRVPGA